MHIFIHTYIINFHKSFQPQNLVFHKHFEAIIESIICKKKKKKKILFKKKSERSKSMDRGQWQTVARQSEVNTCQDRVPT